MVAAGRRRVRRAAWPYATTRLPCRTRELAAAADRFGAALVESGVEPGDRVAIWCFNCADWVVAVLGIFAAGGVLVPVNTRFKGPEAADLLARSRAKVLVTVTDFLDTDYVALLEGAGTPLPDLATTVVVRGPVPDGALSWGDFMGRAGPESLDEVGRRSAALSADDPSDILFTSGTTGVPKGVVMTHGRTLTIATDWVAMTGLSAGDVYLQVNPYFHMFGLKAGILASVAAGATMLPEPVFDVDRVLSRVAVRAGHRPARSADALPVHPRPPRPGGSRPLDLAGRRHRRRRHPGRADPAGRRRAALLQGDHRLRIDRRWHRLRHLGRRRRRGRGHHGGAPSARVRGAHRRRGRARGRAGRGRRGPPARWEHHARLPRRSRRDGQGAHGRRLAAHR